MADLKKENSEKVEEKKKGFGAKFMNFLMMGGFIVVLIVIVAIVVLVEMPSGVPSGKAGRTPSSRSAWPPPR